MTVNANQKPVAILPKQPIHQNVALAGIVGVALAFSAATSVASADLIDATYAGVHPRQTVSFSDDGGATFDSLKAGTFKWVRVGGTYTGPGADNDFITFCIDLDQTLHAGTTYQFNTADPADAPVPGPAMGSASADLLSQLFGQHYATNANPWTNDSAAAFQVAVWEIINDNDLRLDQGDFRVSNSGAFYADAQWMLDSLNSQGPRAELLAMTHPDAQDQVFMVPTPGSLVLLALGGVVAGFNRRPSRRKQQHA